MTTYEVNEKKYEGIQNVVAYVKVLDVVVEIDKFTEIEIPQHLTKWEIGGITDPIGQLGQWLWENIQNSFKWLEQQIWNFLMTVKDMIINAVKGFIDTLWNSIKSAFDSLQRFFEGLLKQIIDAVDFVSQAVSQGFSQVATLFQQVFTEISTSISTIIDQLASSISQVINFIQSIANQILSTIQQIPQTIIEGLRDFFKSILDAITTVSSALSSVANQILSALSQIPQAISQIAQGIWNALQQVGQSIMTTLQQLGTQMASFFQQLPTMLMQGLQWLGQQITTAFTQFTGVLQSALEQFASGIVNFFTDLFNRISGAINWIGNILQGFVNPLVEIWNWLRSAFWNAIQGIWNALQQVGNFFAQIPQFFTWLGSQIWNGLQWIGEQIWNALQQVGGFFTWLGNQIWSGLQWIGEQIWNGLQWAWEQIVNFFTVQIPQFFTWLGQGIWNWIQLLGQTIWNGLQWVWQQISGFFTWLGSQIWDGLQWIGNQVSNAIYNAFMTINDFINTIRERLTSLIEDASQFITNLSQAIQNLPQTLSDVFSQLASGFSQLAQTLLCVFQQIASALIQAQQWIWSAVSTVGEVIAQAFISPFQALLDTFKSAFMEISNILKMFRAGKIEQLKQELGVTKETGELFLLVPLAIRTVSPIFLTHLGLSALFGLGSGLGKFEIKVLGSGLAVRIGEIFEKVWEWIKSHSGFLMHALLLPIWSEFIEFIKYPIRYVFRNQFPYELPTISEGREMVQRFMPTDRFESVLAEYHEVLKLRGYNDKFIDMFAMKFDPQNSNTFIKVTDRFGTERKIPLSLIYDIPTASELCRMMVRDIFASLDDFANVISMRGMVKDIAYMFYFLHFKYVSTEKLWEFYTRAQAFMLWFKPTEEELNIAKEEAKKLGAFEPKPPSELNVSSRSVAELHMKALSTYMKWHDYAKFSWIKDYASDNYIVIDLLADIPTRIDARWMWKWGIFSGLGIDKAKELAPTLLGNIPPHWSGMTEGETFDAFMLARINIARGMHPEWIPFITLAEMWNAYAEERTLIRTGFMNLFKEGYWKYEDVDELMRGFFKLKFKILAYDSNDKLFKPKEIELPVKFLEGERKLLELRMLMDRALDILRDYTREMIYACADNIYNPNQFTKLVEDEINIINDKFFKQLMQKIGGKERALQLDKSYFDAYIKVVESYHKVYTIRRIRTWIRYILYRIYHRIQQGYVSKAEIEKMMNEIVEKGKLTKDEKELLLDVANFMEELSERMWKVRVIERKLRRGEMTRRQAVQELMKLGLSRELAEEIANYYMPYWEVTISRLASILEDISLPNNLIEKVIEAEGVPEEWKGIVKQWIKIRPIRSEANRLVTELISDYAYGVIDKSTLERMLAELEPFGVTKEERELLLKLAELRRKRYEYRRMRGR